MKHKLIVIYALCWFLTLSNQAFSETESFKIDMNRVEAYQLFRVMTVNDLKVGEHGYLGKYNVRFCSDDGSLKIVSSKEVHKKINPNRSTYKVVRTAIDQVEIQRVEDEAKHNALGADVIVPVIAASKDCRKRLNDGSKLLSVTSFLGESSLTELYRAFIESGDRGVVENQAIKIQKMLDELQSRKKSSQPKEP